MRQRTVSDYFWRDPDICDLSHEDKATLLYFMTSPSSNIVGVYQIVWRIAAAEMGWTADQLIVVSKRLKKKQLVDFTDAGWIFVKIWWKHNSAAGAFSPKLLAKAKAQCDAMPSQWLDEFLVLLEKTGVDRVLIGYSYSTDIVPLNSTTNCSYNSNPTTTKKDELDFQNCGLSTVEVEALQKMLSGGNYELAQSILDEIVGLKQANGIRKNVVSLANGLLKKASTGGFVPAAGLSIKSNRVMRRAESPKRHSSTSTATVAAAGIAQMRAVMNGKQ